MIGSDARARLPREPALDGLRGVAVAAVLLYHAGLGRVAGGYLGVSTFFTLSGYLITSLLLTEHERSGRIALGAFWERRARRILPAALVTLAGIALFGALVADGYQLARLRGDGLAALVWAVNWWFIATERDYVGIFASPSPLQHFWSLAIEEQFYAVFPLLAAILLRTGGRRRLGAVLAMLCLVSAAWMRHLAATDASTARLYYGTDTRAAELLAGAVLATCVAPAGVSRRPWWSARALLGVVGAVVCGAFWSSVPQEDMRLYAGGLAVYTAATVAVLAAAVSADGPVTWLLAMRPLRWLGRISYGLYLYHFPLFLWLTPERTSLPDAWLLALRLATAVVVAEASYRVVEAPIRYGSRLRGRRRWLAPIAASTSVALALLAASAGRGAPLPGETEPAAAADTSATSDPNAVRILVVGDSVAGGISNGLERWGRTSGRAVVTGLTQSGCGLARAGEATLRATQQRSGPCLRFFGRWPETIAQAQPQIVVVYAGGWDMQARRLPQWDRPHAFGEPEYDLWLAGQYTATVDALTARGARVVWLTSMCMRLQGPGGSFGFDPEQVTHLNDVIAGVAARRPDRMTIVDLFGAVCPRGRFTNVLDGVRGVRPDGVHFSDAGADWAARWLGPQLLRELDHASTVADTS